MPRCRTLLRAAAIAVVSLTSAPASAEFTFEPERQTQVELRAQYFPTRGVDKAFGTHVGRLRARVPVGSHSLEVILPWVLYDQVADGRSPGDGFDVGNITLGGALHAPNMPVRLALLVGLPTAQTSVATNYGVLANLVEERELYAGSLDYYVRSEAQGELGLMGNGSVAGRIAYVAMAPEERDVAHDLVLGFGGFVENGPYVHGAEFALRTRLNETSLGSDDSADLVFTTGRHIGNWLPTLQIRLPLDGARRDETLAYAGLHLSWMP